MNDNRPIGIFDSGVGGLTIADAIRHALPNESMIYFGDTKHLPYGDKSPEAIRTYVRDITRFLLGHHCKAIVIACNSASAAAFSDVTSIAGERHCPVLDVITPVAQAAATSGKKDIGVIATKATINSGLYHQTIQRINPYIRVHELSTPLLAPLIEEGLANTAVSQAAITHYLTHPILGNIDSLIPGCTHYPLLGEELAAYYRGHITIFDAPTFIADALHQLLLRHELLSASEPRHRFYVSDLTDNFHLLAKRFFGDDIVLFQQSF